MFEQESSSSVNPALSWCRSTSLKQTTSTVLPVSIRAEPPDPPYVLQRYHRITNMCFKPEGKGHGFTPWWGTSVETDTFGINRRIAEIHEDILCIHNYNAYCFSMASNYNSFRPANNGNHLQRQKPISDPVVEETKWKTSCATMVETSIFERKAVK